MSALPTLGVDPGARAGAAVLLDRDGRTVLGAWTWRAGKRKGADVLILDGVWVPAPWSPDPPEYRAAVLDTLSEVARAIFTALDECEGVGLWYLACERLFQTPHNIIALAESAGILMGVLAGEGPPVRRMASQWRSAMGCGKTDALAVECASQRLTWPTGPRWDALRSVGHVAEAGLIAQDAHTQRRGQP